mgnify:FL=1
MTRGTLEAVYLLAGLAHEIRLGKAITEFYESDSGVGVYTANTRDTFDQVVMATQANQTAQILTRATDDERAALQRFRYAPSRVVVHQDEQLAPPGGAGAWAPVNFL